MDGLPLDLTIFLVATFAGAVVAGLSGFAFGLVAASIWLYILTPLQTATLIIAFGLIVQAYSVWKLRHALVWNKLWPFLIGAAIGVPVGVAVLTRANPVHVRNRRRYFSRRLQSLRPVSPCHACSDSRRWRCRRWCGFSQWRSRRHHRTGWHSCDDLVRVTRLAEGPTANDLPARCRRNLCHELRYGSGPRGRSQPTPSGFSCSDYQYCS